MCVCMSVYVCVFSLVCTRQSFFKPFIIMCMTRKRSEPALNFLFSSHTHYCTSLCLVALVFWSSGRDKNTSSTKSKYIFMSYTLCTVYIEILISKIFTHLCETDLLLLFFFGNNENVFVVNISRSL